MTWKELWEKYEAQVKASDASLEGDDLKERVCLLILEKSCCTSEVFNNLAGCSELNSVFGASAFAPGTESTGPTLGAPGQAGGGIDDCSRPAEDTPSEVQPAAECTGEEADGTDSKALARASAVECAAACAGALRLTRLVKPFLVVKAEVVGGQAEEQPKTSKRRERRSVGRQRLSRRATHSRTSA